MEGTRRRHWIVSPAFDLGWFVAPGLLSALVAGLVWGLDEAGGARGEFTIWIVGVLLVDVAHVYASLYRTYLDPEARRLHGPLLRRVPLAVFCAAFALHLIDPAIFWRVLAYLAIFHFIKQHEGFVIIYGRAGGESAADLRLARIAVWCGTAMPVLWWHAQLPRRFAWFVDGDLLSGLPPAAAPLALALEAVVLALFVARRLGLARAGVSNPMVPLLVLTPALCWNLGIVWTNDDRIFTLTNVFLHGVPYLALVWIAGGAERTRGWLEHGTSRRSARASAPAVVIAAVYYGLLLLLAASEEALWDRLIWHDRPGLFGRGALASADAPLMALSAAAVVAALTVPQATHYVLDRHIWRSGPRNPRLAAQLGLDGRGAEPGDPPRPS